MSTESLSSESKYVVDTFIKNFSEYKKKSIAIYGLGINTKNILENINGFNIVGLMDAENTGQYFFGKKVLSYEEVKTNVDMIIIIARKSIVSIIHKRIFFLEKEFDIPIYSIDGKFINNENDKFIPDDIEYWKTNKKHLIDKINKNEIISFDIFDTLIMRKVLEPHNIFDIVERKLIKDYNINLNFKKNRVQSERELNEQFEAPKFDEIYELLQKKLKINNELIELIKKIEIETEVDCIIPRYEMLDVYKYSLSKNKKIYLLSDMYYSDKIIKIFLDKCDITDYEKLIVSSDIGMSKSSGKKFDYYTKLNVSKTMLHIGDNPRVDIQMAQSYNIDTFHVFSAYELFMHSSLKKLLINSNNDDDNIVLGLLSCNLFNNPFILNESKGLVDIDDMYKIGYLFMGPLILKFTLWLIKEVQKQNYTKILFCARDGYLIKKIYDLLIDQLNINMNTESIYFKTSRRAATVPTIQNENDIDLILKKPFKGKKSELLNSRFGIKSSTNDSKSDDIIYSSTDEKDIKEYVMSYKDEILNNSRREAKTYNEYIKSMNINKEDTICIFDFVSSGTIQYYISKFLNKDIDGLYFASNGIPNRFYKNFEHIKTMFGNLNEFNISNNIQKYYFFLESILTDENNTLIKYGSKNLFIYKNSNESERNFVELNNCHNSVEKFIKDVISIDRNIINCEINNELIDDIIGILMSNECSVNNEIKNIFKNESIYDCEKESHVWPN